MQKYVLKRVIGSILILIGIIGLTLPILPGIIFIVLGLGLFGIHISFIDKIWMRIKRFF